MPQDDDKLAFRALLAALAAQETISDGDFAEAVYAALSRFDVSEEQFRDTFGLTAGAVFRWTQGNNLPQPVIRGKILLWIADKI